MSLSLESTLEQSIKKQFEVNKFDSENKYKCERCSKKTQAKHFVKICSLPHVVVFHIKRFAVMGKKLTKSCEYPLTINMSQFLDKNEHMSG